MWFALGLARVLASLPLRLQHAMGRTLGQLAFTLLKSRRRVTITNLTHCFPELNSREVYTLAQRSFESNGVGIFEAFRSWFRRPDSLEKQVRFEGQEHLDAALAKGKGVILLGGHFSTLDLAGNLTTLYFKADVMQRDHLNGLFNAVMTRSRAALYGEVLAKNDVRGLLKSLRQNHVVWYAVDQDYGRNNTVFASFFGLPCATLTTPARIARNTGAAIVPFSHYRLPDSQGYVIKTLPALENFPTGDAVADATRLNFVLETAIREAPEQYLWMHRRFKTPKEPGQKNIYGQTRN